MKINTKKRSIWFILLAFPFYVVYYAFYVAFNILVGIAKFAWAILKSLFAKIDNSKKAKEINDIVVNDVDYFSTIKEINEPTDRLINGELPRLWIAINYPLLHERESRIPYLANIIENSKSIDEKISSLEEIIKEFYSYQSYCYSKDECFTKYFDDMWMHCHNSKSDDFIYITRFEEQLKYLCDNYEEVKAKEDYLKTVDTKIIRLIELNPNGILQVDLLKEFPKNYHEEIRNIIYSLIKEGVIQKEKRGKYNILFPIN